MKILLNIIWHIPFCGFINALCAYICALLFAITIVGLPIAKGLFEYGNFLMCPFGRKMIDSKQGGAIWTSLSIVMSIIWIIFFGWWMFIAAIIQIVALFMSIVGIPVAIVLAKSLMTYINPVGKICVDSDEL